MSTNLGMASQQWANRPDDQRFLSLEELRAAVATRRSESWTATPRVRDIRMVPQTSGLAVELHDPTKGMNRLLAPTNWAFGQLSQFAQAPASYLRKLPAELAAINLQWGLEHIPVRPDALVLAHSNGDEMVRALTSPTYGRIWDSQVVDAVIKVNGDGRWQVPSSSYTTQNPRRATTLYASDRDCFLFLVDPENPIEIDGEKMFRGFFAWNSEVGAATFGLTTFLYRYVCDNRIVWGATNVTELRIRHTSGAPDRFAYEGAKYLRRYADESVTEIVDTIKRAKDRAVPTSKDQTVADWLTTRGFTKAQSKASVDAAVAEEGGARSLWDIVNGITAYARTVTHTDARVELETKAGKLLSFAAA